MKTLHSLAIITCIMSSVHASRLDKLINDVEKCLTSVKKEVQKHPEMGEKIDHLIAITKEETKSALNKTSPLLKPIDKEKFDADCDDVVACFEKDVDVFVQEAQKILSFHQKQLLGLVEKHFDKNNFDSAAAIFETARNTITNAIAASHIQDDFLKVIESLKPVLPQKINVTCNTETDAAGNPHYYDFHCTVK